MKIVDLDDSVTPGKGRRHTIGTNRYRAPEVTLGALAVDTDILFICKQSIGFEWDFPVDAFSVGCVIAELACGRSLFTPSLDVLERIASLEVVVGLFPSRIIQEAKKFHKRLFNGEVPARVKFPPHRVDDEIAKSEAMARIASLSHYSVRDHIAAIEHM